MCNSNLKQEADISQKTNLTLLTLNFGGFYILTLYLVKIIYKTLNYGDNHIKHVI